MIVEKMGPVPQPEEDRDHPSHNEHEIEDAEHPDVVINVDISDSDEEDDDDNDDGYGGYIGYQALSQDGGQAGLDISSESEQEEDSETVEDIHSSPGNNGSAVIENIEEDMECHVPEGLVHQVRHPDYPNTSNLPGYMQVPELPRPDRKDMLWNQDRQSDHSKDTDDTDKIKSVMSNIKLPSSNIPDWAKALSDDQWQVQVVNKLKVKTSQKNNSEVNKGTSQIQDKSES